MKAKIQPVGSNIARVRKDRGLAPEDLASRLGIEVEAVRRLERNEQEPSISDLMRIANALATDISALIYGKEFEDKRAVTTRPTDRVRVERHRDFVYESLAPYYSGRRMEPFLVEVAEESGKEALVSRHAGEEFHYVLEGRLKIAVAGEARLLETGDTIYFDSSLPHSLVAVDKPAKLLSVIYNAESMLHGTRGKFMRDIIHAAQHLKGIGVAVVCPEDSEMEAVNRAFEEGVLHRAYLVCARGSVPEATIRHPDKCTLVEIEGTGDEYFGRAALRAVALVRSGEAQMLMKGHINTALFLKAVLNKETGIAGARRLSLISVFELPGIKRLVFMTDPAINPALSSEDDPSAALDIINNAIDAARAFGVAQPRVALLEANETPSTKLPATIAERELSELAWEGAVVSGPLSYDLALYEESAVQKGLIGHPVAGKADILVVPYISAGNMLYKALVMTMNAEVGSIVAGARVPIVITSRSDSMSTKFLTICACAVYGEHIGEETPSFD